jgi:hypothetical protein
MGHQPVCAYLTGFERAAIITYVLARVVEVSFDTVEVVESQILLHPDQEFAQFGERGEMRGYGWGAVRHTAA